ncbi:hypothetical protein FACS1894110_14000 [Spirochaetia bacterium]|nr:hypothetical protein FACS1894110_14000 [Spirochaetia bacterium]
MNVFVLEDNPGRMEWFRDHFPNNIKFASTYDEAISNYGPSLYNLVFIDHDLLGWRENKHNPLPHDGYSFCKWLIETKDLSFTKIIIHSENKVWAPRIYGLLLKNKIKAMAIPFNLYSSIKGEALCSSF